MQHSSTAKKPGFQFWLLFSIATAAAWSIMLAINVSLGSFDRFRALWLLGILEGLLQWFVLRHWIRHSFWWVIATTASVLLPGIFVLFGGTLIATFILLGTGIMITQWYVLSKSIQQAGLWIVINIIALVITAVVGALPLFLVLISGSGYPLLWAIFGVIAGGVYGIVTGIGLSKMLRHPLVQDEHAEKSQKKFTLVDILTTSIGLILIITPFLAIWQLYSLQSLMYCDAFKIGMPHAEVNKQLEQIRPISESGVRFGGTLGNSSEVTDIPYPESVEDFAAGVKNFYNVRIIDPLVAPSELGLGYDAADKLALISIDSRDYNLNYRIVTCPWTFQNTLQTLFNWEYTY